MYITTKFLSTPKDCKIMSAEILSSGLVKLVIVSDKKIDDTSKEQVVDATNWDIIKKETVIQILE